MKVSVFKNIFETDDPLFVDVLKIFKRIKDGQSKEIIDRIRSEKNPDKRNELKKRLPSICFSGRFGQRGAQFLLEHSGLMCLDIDEVKNDDIEEIKECITGNEFVFGCFVSPSGHGLKVIIKITPDTGNHKAQFLALEKYFNNILNKYDSTKKNKKPGGKIIETQGEFLRVHIDKSGKDVNRVCYESYDPDIYFNEDSERWYECLEETFEKIDLQDQDLIFEKLQTWIERNETYYEGNRNRFLYKFSSALCRYGIHEVTSIGYLHKRYEDYPFKELEKTVKGAYKVNDFNSQAFTEEEKRSRITNVRIKENDEVVVFFSINDKGRVKIDTLQFLKFIETNGFGIYRQSPQDTKWKFVHVNNMIVDIVTVIDIKKHILDFVKKHAPEPVFDELQMKNRYFENTFLNALPLIEVNQIRDERDSSYLFFENFYYRITKDGSEKHDYIDLKGQHIWRSQICSKTITEKVDYDQHDFNQFIINTMGGDIERYKSACCSIGYGLHTYKKERLAKLIYACDESHGELDALAEGGTGKNLFFKVLKHCRSLVEVDGKDFDKRDKFKFQTVGDDTQIVMIDDYEGDIKEMFTKVTGHFEIEKKGLDKTIIDFANSPKLFLCSNYSPKGYSSSFARRLHLLEFSDHYNHEHTPSDDFGDRDFFSDDWTQDDWNAVYSFLFDCLRLYFTIGLPTPKIDNEGQKYKQLVKNTGRTFAEHFKDFEFKGWHPARDMFNEYKNENEVKDLTLQSWYGQIRKMCGIYGWKLEVKGRGINKEIQVVKK